MTPQEQDAFTRLVDLGWSPVAAAGIVGNLRQESGLNPNASHDQGTGYGIAGWRDPQPGAGRWTNLRSFAAERGLPVSDMDTQLQFLDHELRTSEKSVGARLKAAADPTRAAATFLDYERPGGWQRGNPTGANGYDNRVAAAQRLYQAYGGAQPRPLRAPLNGGTVEASALPLVTDTPDIDTNAQQTAGQEDPYAAFSTIADEASAGDPYAAFSTIEGDAPATFPKRDGLFLNTTAGLNDAIYSTAGAPVDATTWALNKGIGGINYLTGADIPQITDPVGGSRSIAKAFGSVGVPDPESVRATTPGEKVARAAGAGAGYMVAPELAVRGLAQGVGRAVSPLVDSLIGSSRSAGDVAANTIIGASGGAAGEKAAQAVPEPYRPLAELGGNLIGGGVGALATGIPRTAATAARAGRDYVAPLTAGGRERLAADTLTDAATSPAALRDALEQGPGELVPGSKPTTFQLTGDMGIGGLERVAETRRAEPFNQRRAEQNQARVSALENVQPSGSPDAVVKALRQNLAGLDAETTRAIEAARSQARERVGALGGEGTPEGYGATLRQSLDDTHAQAKARESALWEAVDPGRKLVLDASPIRAQASRLVSDMPISAKPFEGEERDILDTVANYNTAVPFREVAALRTRVNTAMSEELSQRGRTPVYARLSQLRGAIERSIEETVAGKAQQEAQAVASGAMRPEDTMLAQWESAISAGKERWLADRAGGIGQEAVGSGRGSTAAGASPFPRASRNQGQSGGGFNDAARAQGTPSSLTPNFDQAARDRLTAATSATKQRARTYEQGAVGEVLRRAGTQDVFRLPLSEVGRKFFRAGSRGYENVQALRKAAASPEVNNSIRDYAVMTLRRAAELPDGTLDPAKVTAWRQRYRDALRAFPEIDGMLKGPVEASEAVTRLMAAKKQAMEEFQAGKVRQLIGVDNADDAVRAIGGIFSSSNPVQIMRQLAKEAARDPEARAGLRKAVADFMLQRMKSNTEAATSGTTLLRSDQFQTFMKQAEPALRSIFSPAETSSMKAIADDLQRSARSVNAVKLPGRSNSPQDIVAQMRASNQPESLLARILTSGASLGAGAIATGSGWGALAGVAGAELIGALRRAGITKVDDLVTDALLNPDRARALLAKYPGTLSKGQRTALIQRYRRSWPVAATMSAGAGDEKAEPQPLRISVP
ncbi:hypothetical protein FHS55_001566 [Angulomicrobium tetraedrale]|uniref:Phage tail lysozyme domain-containing protein n=1 Tax=Ancylobacter tetraedralis TaxID=217068 RepID=A0A839Z7B9_9HYPH|nr:phage tail tip lysozyme [Ancylobacter tetraedralis]MBB3770971.1 hypothetical protein [Ancylobacter tetraedralis]